MANTSTIQEKQKKEAIKRMKMLKLHSNVIADFKEDVLNYSEYGMGILFWVEDEEWKSYIRDFETRYNAKVYHVIHSHTELGELLSMLYVSDDEEEWEWDRKDLQVGISCAYVENLNDPYCSEIGSIGIQPIFGGIRRTA